MVSGKDPSKDHLFLGAVQQQVDRSAGTVSRSQATGEADQRVASSSSAYDIVGASPLTK